MSLVAPVHSRRGIGYRSGGGEPAARSAAPPLCP